MMAYVIKDKNDFPVASTFSEAQAMRYCNENEECSYLTLPFLLEEGAEIHMIAGPIDKKYLPKDFLK
jgi:hypothetical protein